MSPIFSYAYQNKDNDVNESVMITDLRSYETVLLQLISLVEIFWCNDYKS